MIRRHKSRYGNNSMMIIYLVTLLALVFSAPVVGSDAITSKKPDLTAEKIFEYAQTRNVSALENLKAEVSAANDALLQNAYSLALYIASPGRYENQFVDNFPEDSATIMNVLYPLGLMDPPGFLYSIGAIGRIAETGNEKAIMKVLIGVSHSDGAVTALFCQYVVELLDRHTWKTLVALSRITARERRNSYACFIDWEPKFISLQGKLRGKIEGIDPTDQVVKKVIQEIEHIKNIDKYQP